MTPLTQRKADRLRADGKVHPVDLRAAFLVEGDHGAYVVVADRAGVSHCSCQASGECSHILACEPAGERPMGAVA